MDAKKSDRIATVLRVTSYGRNSITRIYRANESDRVAAREEEAMGGAREEEAMGGGEGGGGEGGGGLGGGDECRGKGGSGVGEGEGGSGERRRRGRQRRATEASEGWDKFFNTQKKIANDVFTSRRLHKTCTLLSLRQRGCENIDATKACCHPEHIAC